MKILASVFINKKENYVVVPTVALPQGGRIRCDNATIISFDNAALDLGDNILRLLDSGPEIHQLNEKPYWKTLGYRSLPAFMKDHYQVSIQKLEDCYRVIRWVKGKGGFTPITEPNAIIILPLTTTSSAIFHAVDEQFRLLTSSLDKSLERTGTQFMGK